MISKEKGSFIWQKRYALLEHLAGEGYYEVRMKTKELIVKEIDDFPESYLIELLEYIRSMKARLSKNNESCSCQPSSKGKS
jgi:hypothetical protein